MKIRSYPKSRILSALRRGFTLIEMTVVIVLAVLIASTGTMMMSQQVSFYKWLNAQSFVLEEAPIANSLVVRIMSQADAFRIHGTTADALADINGLTANGKVLVVGFAQPNGDKEYGLIEFTTQAGAATGSLKFHKLNTAGTSIVSSWTITNGAANVDFSFQNGILIMDMTGPYGAQIQYAASSSL